MTADWPACDEVTLCPKCGRATKTARITYCVGDMDDCPALGNSPMRRYGDHIPEHLDRECLVCGYRWVERCYDDDGTA